MFLRALGLVQGTIAKIHVDLTATPKFFKARSVPYTLQDKVDKDLKKEGVIQPITHSDWAAPVVPVVKHDGSVRLCGDFKITVNPFRISSAPAIFQGTIENFLQNLPHTCMCLDGILITGKTESKHIQNLEEVLTCLEKAGLYTT